MSAAGAALQGFDQGRLSGAISTASHCNAHRSRADCTAWRRRDASVRARKYFPPARPGRGLSFSVLRTTSSARPDRVLRAGQFAASLLTLKYASATASRLSFDALQRGLPRLQSLASGQRRENRVADREDRGRPAPSMRAAFAGAKDVPATFWSWPSWRK